jgi:ankyrin repeat protein
VQSFFAPDGSLIPPATPAQMTNGLAWACEFGRTAVVEFLLTRGLKADEKLPHHGQTSLHWAAYGGHSGTVKALLERAAPIDATDDVHHGTPLEWALYQWGNSPHWASRGSYYETVALLVRAGAQLRPEWFIANDEERSEAMRKLRGDGRMQSALRGEITDP